MTQKAGVLPGRLLEYTEGLALYVSQPALIQRRPAFGQTLETPILASSRQSASAISWILKEFAMAPMNGTIKRLVSDKGFGFILASDGNEYFFHNSACSDVRFDDLREGQAVTFERGQGPKGPRGENVRLA
jgi:CspA family cold shock protein